MAPSMREVEHAEQASATTMTIEGTAQKTLFLLLLALGAGRGDPVARLSRWRDVLAKAKAEGWW